MPGASCTSSAMSWCCHLAFCLGESWSGSLSLLPKMFEKSRDELGENLSSSLRGVMTWEPSEDTVIRDDRSEASSGNLLESAICCKCWSSQFSFWSAWALFIATFLSFGSFARTALTVLLMWDFWGLGGWFWRGFWEGSCSAGGGGVVAVIFKEVSEESRLKRKGKRLACRDCRRWWTRPRQGATAPQWFDMSLMVSHAYGMDGNRLSFTQPLSYSV